MGPHDDMAQFLPSNRRRPRRRPVLAPVLGAITTLLTLLTLCVFASHLPALQRVTSGTRQQPLSGGGGTAAHRPRVVTPRDAVDHHPAPEPHHGSPPLTPPTPPPVPEGPSEIDVILSIIDEQIKQAESWPDHMEYGANKHPPFKDDPPMLVADLPRKYVPSYSPPNAAQDGGGSVEGASKISARRLVIVGDVHGHLVPLKSLLRKVGFDNKQGDHLILAGDIVTKGPDSRGVVKLAMELGASAVRGNQDDRVLAAARELRRLSADDKSRLGQEQADAEDGAFVDTAEDNNDGGKVDAETRRRDHARKVARSLSRAQLAWLKSHPIILRVTHLQNGGTAPWDASTLVVVHGGLVPGVKLEKQDPWAVMNMRSLVYPGKGKRKDKGKGKKHHSQGELTHTDDDTATAHATRSAEDATLAPESVAVPVDGRKGEPWSHAW